MSDGVTFGVVSDCSTFFFLFTYFVPSVAVFPVVFSLDLFIRSL
jgi:hypothetical protein